MRKTVHLCLSSHDEVLFRNETDLAVGFNCFAVAALTTESRALAEGRMSTHHHSMAQSDNPVTGIEKCSKNGNGSATKSATIVQQNR